MTQMVDHFKEAMRLLIAAPIHLRGHYYGTKFSDGRFVPHESMSQANCFCIIGALYKAYGYKDYSNKLPVGYMDVMGFKTEGDAIIWNFRATKNEVLTRFAETINKLEKQS